LNVESDESDDTPIDFVRVSTHIQILKDFF